MNREDFTRQFPTLRAELGNRVWGSIQSESEALGPKWSEGETEARRHVRNISRNIVEVRAQRALRRAVARWWCAHVPRTGLTIPREVIRETALGTENEPGRVTTRRDTS